MSGRAAVVDVFDFDRELADVTKRNGDHPQTLRAAAVDLPRGTWSAPRRAESGALGLLVLDGVLTRSVRYGPSSCCELLGPGDLLRPWLEDAEAISATDDAWEVVEPAQLALLNGRAAQLCASRPELVAKLLDRALLRSRRRTMLSTIAATKRIEDRLLLLFGHLGARWGRVTPAGVTVSLPLTHALLAELVAARRPTVTTACRALRDAELLERHDGSWLLTPAGQEELAASDK